MKRTALIIIRERRAREQVEMGSIEIGSLGFTAPMHDHPAVDPPSGSWSHRVTAGVYPGSSPSPTAPSPTQPRLDRV